MPCVLPITAEHPMTTFLGRHLDRKKTYVIGFGSLPNPLTIARTPSIATAGPTVWKTGRRANIPTSSGSLGRKRMLGLTERWRVTGKSEEDADNLSGARVDGQKDPQTARRGRVRKGSSPLSFLTFLSFCVGSGAVQGKRWGPLF